MTTRARPTAVLLDPAVARVGVDPEGLIAAARGLGAVVCRPVTGLARHPERLTAAAKETGARAAVVVTAGHRGSRVAELRTWGVAGGLDPLGVQSVELDVLASGRSPAERAAYAARLVGAAVAALRPPLPAAVQRRSLGPALSRRGLLSGRLATWQPVVEVDGGACVGTARCGDCLTACPEQALGIRSGPGTAVAMVDPARCTACTRCLGACPSGALCLDGHDPLTLSRRLQALLDPRDGARQPALVLGCHRALEPVHRLGERVGLPGLLPLGMACLGGVGSTWPLAALAAGARAVGVLPCEECRAHEPLAEQVGFVVDLLSALGDEAAGDRVRLLPADGPRLRGALAATAGLVGLVQRPRPARMPGADRLEAAARLRPQVAAWAVAELEWVTGLLELPRRDPEAVIGGAAAPLGTLSATGAGCTGCAACTTNCPSAALSLVRDPGKDEVWLDPTRCTGCGLCVRACPEQALRTDGVEVTGLGKGRVPVLRSHQATCRGCGEPMVAVPANATVAALPPELTECCPACRRAALAATGALSANR